MALTRAQLLSGNQGQGAVLSGQVQAVKQGPGILIDTDGTIRVDSTTVTGLMKLNSLTAYNSYVWPGTAGSAGQFLESDGAGNLDWKTPQGFAVVTVSNVQPSPPDVGELWYDTGNSVLKVYQTTVAPTGWTSVSQQTGLGLVISGSAIKVSIPVQFGPPAASTLPAGAVDGSLYWDNNQGLLFIQYNDGNTTQWVQVVPSGAPSTVYTGTVPISVSGSAISLNIGLGNAESGGFLKATTPVLNGPPAAGLGQLQAIDGSLYWDNNQGLLFVRYNDGNTTQWVQVTPVTPAPSGFSGSFLSQAGQIVTVSNGIITSVV